VSSRDARRHAPAETAARWAELTEWISRCARLLRTELGQHTAAAGLSESQFSLLWACTQGPAEGLNQSQIAAVSAVSAAHVSNLVEQLRTRGLLEGHRRSPDRRRQVWQITELGRQELASLLDRLASWANPLDQGLGRAEREALVGLLQQLARLLSSPGCHLSADAPSAEQNQRGAA
jgi:DNA-binding MarR family transcriptional regulator